MNAAQEKEERAARLAAQLRDNLKRRKAQAREAATATPPPATSVSPEQPD